MGRKSTNALAQLGSQAAKGLFSPAKAKAKIDPEIKAPSEAELFGDIRKYCENLLVIRNKQGKIVPFIWNEVQKKLHAKVSRESEKGNKRRLILKYRRPGISTYMQARNFFLTANSESQYAVTLAHDNPSTQKIFEISLLFYNKLPDWARPERATENRKELNFSKMGSMFYIGTAGGRSFGRGQTIQRVHCSEVAFYPKSVDVANLMAGLMEACSHGEMDLESTANGHGNWYHKAWLGAKNNENAFVPIFLSWKDDPELSLPTSKTFDELRLDTKEEELINAYALTPSQIVWRRYKMRELTDPENGSSMFHQEYPINDVEAFIATGACFFDAEIIQHLANLVQPPESTSDNGRLKIFRQPIKHHTYVIGADIGEGVPGGDRTAITIIDTETCEEVACWTGICSPEDAARKMADLGYLYEKASLAPEANSFGHSTINTLINELNYPHIYQHTDYQRVGTGDGGSVLPKWGWQTTPKTRPIMLSEFREAIQGGYFKVNDKETFDECMCFVDTGHGKYEAPRYEHDDRVIARAIAWQARKRAVDLSDFSQFAIDTGYKSMLAQWEEAF